MKNINERRYMLLINVSKRHDSADVIAICILFQQYTSPQLYGKQPHNGHRFESCSHPGVIAQVVRALHC